LWILRKDAKDGRRAGVPAPTTELIHSLASAGRYVLSIHAEHERQSDKISTAELEAALRDCEIIEDYPEDTRGHSCLTLGLAQSRPIHTVCTIKDSPREILLITVYDPTLRPDKWEPDFRHRRKP
jgi:hypothetical protein